MYLNTSIRGYPKGIRAGNDPRKPSIQVDDSFQHVIHCGIPYKLESIEVWGCGSPKNRYCATIQQFIVESYFVKYSHYFCSGHQ